MEGGRFEWVRGLFEMVCRFVLSWRVGVWVDLGLGGGFAICALRLGASRRGLA